MRRVHPLRPLLAIPLLPAVLLGLAATAEAAPIVSVSVGGTTITGDSGDAGFTFSNADFASNPTGYTFSGRVLAVDTPANARISLFNFTAARPAGAAGGSLEIDFAFTAQQPPSPVIAVDTIFGSIDNTISPFILGSGNVVIFQGFVNTIPIVPPAGPSITAPGGGTNIPVPIGGAHGPLTIGGGPPWMLRGFVSVTLGTTGDEAVITSTGTGFSRGATVSITPIPGPSSLVLGTIGGLTGLGAWWRRRGSATARGQRSPGRPSSPGEAHRPRRRPTRGPRPS
jgi:hypothetical protein